MASKPVHRHDDERECGATTVVIGQDDTFANGKLIAVHGDINTHENGQLDASNTDNFYINNKLVVNHTPDLAEEWDGPDKDRHSPSATQTAEGSDDVFCGDK